MSLRALLSAVVVATIGARVSSPAATSRDASGWSSALRLPVRVHVFEDFETDIEKRWWLRGTPETNNVPPSLSASVPNRRARRATASKDFDDKQGDWRRIEKPVIFNPVPGPPMGRNTRLSFRYWLDGTDRLRVQIFSLAREYHRFLTLTNLPQRSWRAATVDMTQARRPDGSGGPLAKDERIDDIQFYISANAELLIDDIVLYEAALPNETELFPKRFLFTGWFDTGKQGVEWPGDFEIVNHQPPQTWKAAKSILNAKTGQPWIRLSLRGPRPLSDRVRLRFRYWLQGQGTIALTLANSQSGQHWESSVMTPTLASWAQATTDFKIDQAGTFADELRFLLAQGAELLIDDVLLYEPGSSESAKPNRVF